MFGRGKESLCREQIIWRQYIHKNVMRQDIHTNVMHQYVHTNVMHQDIHTNVIQMCLAEARNCYAGNRSFGVLCTKHSCEHKCYASICCAILSIDKCYHLTCFLFTKNLWSMDTGHWTAIKNQGIYLKFEEYDTSMSTLSSPCFQGFIIPYSTGIVFFKGE